jgi:alanine racemase
MGWHPEEIHMANSSGLIHNRADRLCTMARPGIALYGAYPDESAPDIIELVPAMTVSAPVHSVRLMKEGETTGYGSTYTFTRETSLAILKTGYGCGYPRAMSNRADVLINGVRCPVVGRVCMQAVMVDASFAGEVRAGDEAVLWGRQQGRLIRPEEAAAWAGTISYELMCLAGKINNRKSGGDNKDYVWNRSS